MRRAAVALAALALVARPARGEGEERPSRPLLARAADEKDPGHAEAAAAWKTLSPDDRATLARAALRLADPGTALVAAIAADPEDLDLEELHLQTRAQAPDPLARVLTPASWASLLGGRPAFGSKDLPAIWAALGKREPGPKDLDWSGLHRSLLPEDVPDLVPLLETAGPKTFRALLADLVLVAEQQGGAERRGDFVRAFRFGLARLRAEAARKRPPRLAALPALPAKAGLPAEFVEVAKGAWLDEPGFAAAGKAPQESSGVPVYWLHHWALETTPTDEDVPFLLSLIEGKRTLEATRRWAARRIAALSGGGGLQGRAAGHTLRKVLASGDATSLFAAAERAAHGEADDWKALSAKAPKDLVARTRWIADPAGAEATALQAISKGEGVKDLEEAERWSLEHDEGIAVPAEALKRIADRVAAGTLPLRTESWFYAKVDPDALTPDVAARLASTWVARVGDLDPQEPDARRVLALLDARAPDATVPLLRAWAKAEKDPARRSGVLGLLARTGDAELVPDLLDAWKAAKDDPDRALGRVHDPRVEAFLRAAVADPAGETALPALGALAVFYGAPESLAGALGGRAGGTPSPVTLRTVADLVLAKDPVGAATAWLREVPPAGGDPAFAGLASSKDPRALDLLRAWRRSHEGGRYWPATGALALAGDEAARAEWRAFLAEDRAFLLDDVVEGTTATMDGDPEWTAFWVSRLDANCCHALHASTVLRATYPTLPVENAPGDAGRARLGAERWFAKNRGAFARSRLLDGWVPGSPSK